MLAVREPHAYPDTAPVWEATAVPLVLEPRTVSNKTDEQDFGNKISAIGCCAVQPPGGRHVQSGGLTLVNLINSVFIK